MQGNGSVRSVPGTKICNPTKGAELHYFIPARVCLTLTSSKEMLPSLVCPPWGAGLPGCRATSCQLPPLFCWSANMNFEVFASESGWPAFAFSKHKRKENPQIVLFFARLLPRQDLSRANLAHPRRPPRWQLRNQTSPTWGISCHSDVHMGRGLFILYLYPSSSHPCASESRVPPSRCPAVSSPSLPPLLLSA